MTDSHQDNDSRDFEGEFFRLLQTASEGWEPPATVEVHKDFFDASLGSQAGVTSDGTPVVLLTFHPEGMKIVLDSCRYWRDHNCMGAAELALYLMHYIGAELEPLLDQMPPELQTFEPFKHSH